jgi:hypothetical protein
MAQIEARGGDGFHESSEAIDLRDKFLGAAADLPLPSTALDMWPRVV